MGTARHWEQDERVISAFLTNYRAVDIMAETGLSKSTVYKLRNHQEFQKVIKERKQAILKTAVNRMQSYLTKDVQILQEIIEDPETSAQVKINGIRLIMEQLRDWTMTTDIIKRLEALENPSEDVTETF
jgi:hypothetical protein